jgi:hypothetical protein
VVESFIDAEVVKSPRIVSERRTMSFDSWRQKMTSSHVPDHRQTLRARLPFEMIYAREAWGLTRKWGYFRKNFHVPAAASKGVPDLVCPNPWVE